MRRLLLAFPVLFLTSCAKQETAPTPVADLPHATVVKNLFLVGRENLPGLVLEGDLISGWGCARLVSSGPARKHLLPRRVLIGG